MSQPSSVPSEIAVQLGAVSASGPHSVMEIEEEPKLSAQTAHFKIDSHPNDRALGEVEQLDSLRPTTGRPDDREDCGLSETALPDGGCVGKRPPPLEVSFFFVLLMQSNNSV